MVKCKNVDINIKDSANKTGLMYAEDKNHTVIISYINNHIEGIDKDPEISESKLGKEHINIVDTLEQMGAIYHIQKEYSLALTLYKQCVNTKIHLFGKNHEQVYTIHDIIHQISEENRVYKIKTAVSNVKDIRSDLIQVFFFFIYVSFFLFPGVVNFFVTVFKLRTVLMYVFRN